jgi:hypothetical protein
MNFKSMSFLVLATVLTTLVIAQTPKKTHNARVHANGKKETLLLDSIFNFICEQKILHPEIVIKQVIIETGWLTSPYLMSKNNLFGFRKKKYLSFYSWQESVEYYKKWQDKYYKNTDEDYFKFLIRIKYATNNYPEHLKKIKFNKTCN